MIFGLMEFRNKLSKIAENFASAAYVGITMSFFTVPSAASFAQTAHFGGFETVMYYVSSATAIATLGSAAVGTIGGLGTVATKLVWDKVSPPPPEPDPSLIRRISAPQNTFKGFRLDAAVS
ncbi:MAG: hypothetical protein AAF549_04980 [Pseudomonadota bacterium]